MVPRFGHHGAVVKVICALCPDTESARIDLARRYVASLLDGQPELAGDLVKVIASELRSLNKSRKASPYNSDSSSVGVEKRDSLVLQRNEKAAAAWRHLLLASLADAATGDSANPADGALVLELLLRICHDVAPRKTELLTEVLARLHKTKLDALGLHAQPVMDAIITEYGFRAVADAFVRSHVFPWATALRLLSAPGATTAANSGHRGTMNELRRYTIDALVRLETGERGVPSSGRWLEALTVAATLRREIEVDADQGESSTTSSSSARRGGAAGSDLRSPATADEAVHVPRVAGAQPSLRQGRTSPRGSPLSY